MGLLKQLYDSEAILDQGAPLSSDQVVGNMSPRSYQSDNPNPESLDLNTLTLSHKRAYYYSHDSLSVGRGSGLFSRFALPAAHAAS